MLLWIFSWAARESPGLLVLSLISDVVARASIMAAFIGLVKSISAVASAKIRAEVVHAFTAHHIPMRPGLVVLMIACALAATFLVSAIAVTVKRRAYEQLGARVSALAHQKMVRQFQLELKSLPAPERRASYALYQRFEDPIITAMKTGASNSVELFAVFILFACTFVYLAVLDYRFLVFIVAVIASFGVFSVGFYYREHLASSRQRQARSKQLDLDVRSLVEDFIDDDDARSEAARASFHKLKLKSLIEVERGARGSEEADLLTKLLGFLSNPANTQIVISTPVFIFIVFYAYYESYAQEVTLVSIFTILFIARFMLQFAQNLVGEARKFALKYRNIRIYYMINVMGRRLLPMMTGAQSKPDDKSPDEDEDDGLP
jgi:ABC-type multidrug transport system fused ATPase/permease subunit